MSEFFHRVVETFAGALESQDPTELAYVIYFFVKDCPEEYQLFETFGLWKNILARVCSPRPVASLSFLSYLLHIWLLVCLPLTSGPFQLALVSGRESETYV